MFRDKRVRNSALVMPIVLIFGLMSIMGFVFGSLTKAENTKVHVVNADSDLGTMLRMSKIQVVPVTSVEAGKKMVEKGDARVLLVLPTNDDGKQSIVDAYVDPKQETGNLALNVVEKIFGVANQQHLMSTLRAASIPDSEAEKIKVNTHEILVGSKASAGDFLVGLLPYLIVIWAFYGGMGVASDLVAGEKEKFTLETLLITPVRRTEIVLGKFIALSTVCLLSSMSSLLGIVLLGVLKLPGSSEIFKDGLGVTPVSICIIILLMLPLVALFASLLVGISSFAKNSREAQTFLAQMSFVVIMPAVFSQFIGYTDLGSKLWINMIPVLSTANNIRLLLLGKPDMLGIAVSILVSLLLAAIALRWTVKMFNREQVLVRI